MATYISNQSGNWSTASTWVTAAAGSFSPSAAAGAPPQSNGGDRFIIRNGHVVTYDTTGEFGDDGSYFASATTDAKFLSNAIVLSGAGSTLKAHRTNATSLSCRGSIVVGYGSSFDWGTTSDPVTANAELIFGTYSSAMSTISSRAGRCGLFTRNNTLTNYHTITMCGNNKTRNTTLSGTANTGSSTITAGDVTGWKVGDKIVIEPHIISSSSTGLLNLSSVFSTTINNINGNVITLASPLSNTYPSGLYVGNFSSNISYKSAAFITGTNPVACGPQIVAGQNALCNYIFKNVSFENLTQPTFDNDNASIPATFGMCFADIGNTPNPITFDGVSILTDKNYANCTNMGFLNKSAATHLIKNVAAVDLYTASIGVGTFIFSRFGPSITISDCVSYRHPTIFSFDQTNSDQMTIKNVRANNTNQSFAGNFSVNNLKVNSSTFRFTRTTVFPINFISLAVITDCTFIAPTGATFRLTDPNSIGSWASITFNNPTISFSLPEPPTSGLTNTFSPTTFVNLYSVNSVTTDNRRYNSFYSISSDYTNRNRGLASYKIKASVVNSVYYATETTDGFAGVAKRFIGYIKYDSVYGTATLPYITFTDASQTITQTFSCSLLPNTWQKFDISITPSVNGPITMTFTGQTSSTTANVYLDGIPFYPINPKARHYGFVFDDSVSYRTINSSTTLTEAQVSALSIVNNLDYLYDAASYWSVMNPSLTSYTDLFIVNGTVLDFGSRNLIIDSNIGTGFAYNSASDTITINSASLSAGINFTTLKTNGLVTLSSSAILSNVTVNANVSSLNTNNLTGVTVSKLLSYNTNSPTSITYTNCAVTSATNTGSANVTIKRINSIVTYV